jgi:hypothetical protein
MNREIEFHDSTLKEVSIDKSNIIIHFDKAYVHQFEQISGLEKHTGWEQTVNVYLFDAHVEEIPGDLPNDIDDGYVKVNGTKYRNVMKLPFERQGDIEILLITMYGHEFRAKCKSVRTQEVGEASFVENYPDDEIKTT